jgi:amino acid transporter
MQCGWEVAALTFQFSWLNGGPAAIIYGAIIAGIGSSLVAAAFGEMASMDPAVGAQYRWSAKFAPNAPEFWGFIQGWITVIAWLCSMAGAFSVMSNTLSGLIMFNNPTYEPKSWHGTLFLIISVVICVSPNLRLRRIINYLESIGGFLHIANFIVVIVTLLSLAKKSTPKFVFRTLHTGSGWNNPGTAFSIGMLTTAWSISCFDGVLHMSTLITNVGYLTSFNSSHSRRDETASKAGTESYILCHCPERADAIRILHLSHVLCWGCRCYYKIYVTHCRSLLLCVSNYSSGWINS